jgi:serine/threonine protein phosphatase PrpC
LIGCSSGKDTVMPDAPTPLVVRYAVKSDPGLAREENEDAAYGGPRLLAVADGMGGHAAGEVASAAAIEALKSVDTNVPADEMLNVLDRAVQQAGGALRDMVEANPSLQGMGTTLTGIMWSGSQLGLVHIGDSRAYLLRDGELSQLTHDHTLVQSLLDDGRITPEEAASHPQRSLLLQALGGPSAKPDLQLRDARPGDRYLLCSDGLYEVLPAATIARVLSEVAEPADGVAALIDLANEGGGPDNITCIIADVMPLEERTVTEPVNVPDTVQFADRSPADRSAADQLDLDD